jgi:hypothetical protein
MDCCALGKNCDRAPKLSELNAGRSTRGHKPPGSGGEGRWCAYKEKTVPPPEWLPCPDGTDEAKKGQDKRTSCFCKNHDDRKVVYPAVPAVICEDPFPWWIVILAGSIVLTVIIIIVIVRRRRRKEKPRKKSRRHYNDDEN